MRRRLIIIGIALGVLIIPAVIILILVDRNPNLQNTILNTLNTNSTELANSQPVANTNQADPERESILYTARNFSEIYGNESNQNDFRNLTDAQDWGTANYNNFLNRTIAQLKANPDPNAPDQITTKALVMTITKQTAQTASVTVSTQRVETINQADTVYAQNLFLDLAKEGDNWRVDAASWEPR